DNHVQRLAAEILHDDPVIAVGVGADVIEAYEIGVLEVQALGHTPQFNLEIAAHELESDLLASVANGIVHFPEAATADATLGRVALHRPLSRIVSELHRSTCSFYIRPLPVPAGSKANAKSSPVIEDIGRNEARSRQRSPSIVKSPGQRTAKPSFCR